jgi:hypothetical protein
MTEEVLFIIQDMETCPSILEGITLTGSEATKELLIKQILVSLINGEYSRRLWQYGFPVGFELYQWVICQ